MDSVNKSYDTGMIWFGMNMYTSNLTLLVCHTIGVDGVLGTLKVIIKESLQT